MVALQEDPIRVDLLLASVRTEVDGAVALFVGCVRRSHRGRRVTHLEYHAFEPMAEAEMGRILSEAQSRFGFSDAAVVHRTGRVEVGEVAVGIAVAAPHRAGALEACRFIIDTVKERVPIWKKEYFEGGSEWIEGRSG